MPEMDMDTLRAQVGEVIGSLKQVTDGANEKADQLDFTPDNPMLEDPDDRIKKEVSDEDKARIIDIITTYRTGWAPDRLLRIPYWMKNQLMYRGYQVLGWDGAQNMYFDALAWYRQSGNQQDGDDTYLEKYINNITKMLGTGFVGTMSRGVPSTVVKPENADILADTTTAKAGQEALGIIARMNNSAQLVRKGATMLYLWGVYFRHTRIVIDGNWAGWDEVPEYGTVTIEKPNRFHCDCGEDTPVEDKALLSGDMEPAQRICPKCHNLLGPETFMPAESQEFEGQTGTRKIPRAMVKWDLHGPLEVDMDPQANRISDTPLLALDREIDVGTLRKTYPVLLDKIKEGQTATTTPNADYERLRRNESFSKGYAYTSDSFQEKTTLSLIWLQPDAYYRKVFPEKDSEGMTFYDRMNRDFPHGMKVSMIGPDAVDIKEAVLEKEWSECHLLEESGVYSPAIADDVVPFNERLNDNLNIIDDYFERCATGMTIADASKIDRREMVGKTMSAGVINFLQTKGQGVDKPLSEAIMQFKFSLDQNIINYPGMLIDLCQKISGITAQLVGTGTSKDVETFGGQKLQADMSQTHLNIYWENMSDETAAASLNSIEWLQTAHKMGLIKELWDVIQSNGSEFRNKYVDLEKMQGKVRVEAETDEGLPMSPEQVRDTCNMIMEEAGKGNQLAMEIMAEEVNQEIVMNTIGPAGFVLPDAAQRTRTLQHINQLMEQPFVPGIDPQTGQPMNDISVKPEIGTDNWVVLKKILKQFRQKNGDYAKQNPDGWAALEQYRKLAEAMEVQEAIDDAQRKAKVTAAGAPQPDQTVQQEKQLLLQHGAGAVERLAAIGSAAPAPAGVQVAPVVSANKAIADMALKSAVQ